MTVLSAGAVEPGLRPVLAAFERESPHTVKLSFATAPQIRQRLIDGNTGADIVIAPSAVLDELAAGGRLAVSRSGRVPIGRVGIGVAVRPGAPRPDISSADALRRALLEADSLVYNRASTGVYVEALIERFGLTDALKPRTTRYPDGASVMEHVLRGQGREIGLGAMTEIVLFKDKGLLLVGPLPAEVQNTTTYEAAPTTTAPGPAAIQLLGQLGSLQARRLIEAAGIEPVR